MTGLDFVYGELTGWLSDHGCGLLLEDLKRMIGYPTLVPVNTSPNTWKKCQCIREGKLF